MPCCSIQFGGKVVCRTVRVVRDTYGRRSVGRYILFLVRGWFSMGPQARAADGGIMVTDTFPQDRRRRSEYIWPIDGVAIYTG